MSRLLLLSPRFGYRLWLCLCLGLSSHIGDAAIPDFAFIHLSDVHAPMPQSQMAISNLQHFGVADFPSQATRLPAPGFVVATGDLTEFGGGNGWWQDYLAYWKACSLPVYNQLGNHDNTWHANILPLRQSGRAPCYSFDQYGCHFVGLMTATPQDPRPSFGQEQILWLQQDFGTIDRSIPVFVFFHHPLPGGEFASRYDYDRLLDVLRTRNTVLIMAGHSHGHVHRLVQGLDQVTGGSTFGTNSGFSLICVTNQVLRVAYRKSSRPQPEETLIEKRLPSSAPFPAVEIVAPAFREAVDKVLTLSASLSGMGGIEAAAYTVDDEIKGNLTVSGSEDSWKASGSADLGQLLPGAHYLRVDFIKGEQRFSRSSQFFYEPPSHPAAWRAYLGAASKVTPALAQGVLYVGANDGALHAFNASTGAELWSARTGAEILAQPLVLGDRIICANGLGIVTAYSATGASLWSFSASDAVYSSPVVADGKVVFGCNDGTLYALDPLSGRPAWTNADPAYAIESKPFVAGDKVYFGAWDEYIYCVNARNGSLVWKRASEGGRIAKAAKRYYSPADAMPIVVEGKLMIADRNYQLTVLDAQTGEPIQALPKVAAAGISENGRFAYLRKTDGYLVKIDSAAKEIWTVQAGLGAIPTAPTEKNGVVYVATATGLVSALAADSGKLLWQYQASPRLYVMSSVASDGTNAFVTAFDGTLSAIRCRTH